MTELALSPKVETKVGVIKIDNSEAVKSRLQEMVSKYENIVVTDDDDRYKEAKKQRTEVNKMRKALNEMRLVEKRKYQEPVKPFDDEMNSIKKIADDVWEKLDSSIKEIDEIRRQSKMEEIKNITKEYNPDNFDIPFKEDWLNATFKVVHIIDDIKTFVDEAQKQAEQQKQEIKLITDTCEQNGLTPEGYITVLLSGAMDVFEVIQDINLTAERKRQDEAKQAEYEAERERIRQSEVVKEPEPTIEEVIDEHYSEPEEPEEIESLVIGVSGTAKQLSSLIEYMNQNGIEYVTYTE